MKKKVLIIVVCFFIACNPGGNKESESNIKETEEIDNQVDFVGDIRVLSLNTWQEGTSVNGGFDALVQTILQTEADIVLLSEVRNYDGVVFTKRITEILNSGGAQYYSFNPGKSPVILSRFPIVSKPAINTTSLTKCIVKLDKTTQLAVYAAHLDYTHYACYLPRGYDGITWEKLPSPVLDVDKILEQNKASERDEAIEIFVNDASSEQQKGNIVLLAGDFNEPSHLDWTEATKDLFDHNGTVVPWHSSVTLEQSGYLDAYRKKYPDPVKYPGFTWAAYNTNVALSKLVWAPDADERDRIDFIYYNPDERVILKDVIIVGPSASIVHGEGVEDNSIEDKFLKPKGIWPSDHKGVLATFEINDGNN